MEGKRDEQQGVETAGGELHCTAANTESLANREWGKAACSDELIEMWTGADVFRPGELVEWRAPTSDETPSLSTLEKDRFEILSLIHIMCGLRMDGSDFLVSVLAHYGIEWCHLTPNSITVLSIFAHLCEAYLALPPTVEVFAHFYRIYPIKKGDETATLGGVYFRLRDNMKRNYPVYHLMGASHSVWTCLWFYAKLTPSCRLAFRGNALKELKSWNEVLLLSPEQEKQVRQIEELSRQGLTGADIVHDYLRYRISPLRRRAHLACNYTGPTDPTRDSDKDLSEEDIESRLSYLLDLKKTRQEHPRRPTAPVSLIRASTDEKANQHQGLLHVLSTLKAKKQRVEEMTGPESIKQSSGDKPLVPASPRRYTRQSAAHRKTVVPPTPEINSPPVRGHSDIDDEETLAGRETITTAASPNLCMEQNSIDNPDEIEEGTRVALMKPISSIDGKRKFFSSSGPRRKAKYSFISATTNTRKSYLNNCCMKGTSLRKEAAVALNPQPVLAQHSHASSVQKGEKSALFMLANVVDQNKMAEDSVSDLPLHQHVRGSPPKMVDPAQSIAERVQDQEAIEQSASIQVPNTEEEINSEEILDKMHKVRSEYESLSQTSLSELLEQAKKLIIYTKRMEYEHRMLEQQVKGLEEKERNLIETTRKVEEKVSKIMEENTKLKDEIGGLEEKKRNLIETTRKVEEKVSKMMVENTKLKYEIGDQKKMIDELSKQKELTHESLVQKCTEVNRLEGEVTVLQSRFSRANELLKLMTSALSHGGGEGVTMERVKGTGSLDFL